jgi:hypothetical protein
MKFERMLALKAGGLIGLPIRSLFMASNGQDVQKGSMRINCISDGKAASLLGVPMVQSISCSETGLGMWIPYIAKSTVFGELTAGQSWIASGQFSGCYMEVGKIEGRVYGAHISCENANDPNIAAWKAYQPKRTVLFSKKVGLANNLPVGTTQAHALVFLQILGESISAFRVDYIGAGDSQRFYKVFDVTKIESD